MIALTGSPGTIAAAEQMDVVFWRSTLRMEAAQAFDEELWTEIVGGLQSARLAFINCARSEIVGANQNIERLPIVTPPLRSRPAGKD